MIKFKYTAVALIPLSILFSSGVFAADENEESNIPVLTVDGGTVHFTGSIVNAPCVVDVNSEGQTVRLGQYRTDSFKDVGSNSAPVDFTINLINCSAETYKSASVKFTGSTPEGTNDVLALASIQAGNKIAEGVGIQILQDNTPVTVDGSEGTAARTFNDGTNRLPFQARYLALNENIIPGEANASADFSITYQ